ncbi:membrane protein FxsA [Lentibacillus lipolyticus]|nr:membrane protein FxsA [Lentibacillus lipolyticus]
MTVRWLLLALLVVPALEIGVFIWAGNIIGPWWVVALIILTGIVGVSLAKKQGVEAWRRAQLSMNHGQPPADAIIDGICIFIGGVFLFSPGFITDAVGFALVLPYTRGPFKRMLQQLLRYWTDNGKIIYRRW